MGEKVLEVLRSLRNLCSAVVGSVPPLDCWRNSPHVCVCNATLVSAAAVSNNGFESVHGSAVSTRYSSPCSSRYQA